MGRYILNLLGQRMEGSSWWVKYLQLIPLFKENFQCKIGNGKTVTLWHDNMPLIEKFQELNSFVKNDLQTDASWMEEEDMHQLLHTALSSQAYG